MFAREQRCGHLFKSPSWSRLTFGDATMAAWAILPAPTTGEGGERADDAGRLPYASGVAADDRLRVRRDGYAGLIVSAGKMAGQSDWGSGHGTPGVELSRRLCCEETIRPRNPVPSSLAIGNTGPSRDARLCDHVARGATSSR